MEHRLALQRFRLPKSSTNSDVSVDGDEIGTIEIDPLVYSLNLGSRF